MLAAMSLLFGGAATAQETMAPTFTLQAPASCNAQPNYTCSRTLTVVNWTVPGPGIDYSPCNGSLACHVEYCFTPTDACQGWLNSLPSQITLSGSYGDGIYTVQSYYRVEYGGNYYTSPPAATQ